MTNPKFLFPTGTKYQILLSCFLSLLLTDVCDMPLAAGQRRVGGKHHGYNQHKSVFLITSNLHVVTVACYIWIASLMPCYVNDPTYFSASSQLFSFRILPFCLYVSPLTSSGNQI